MNNKDHQKVLDSQDDGLAQAQADRPDVLASSHNKIRTKILSPANQSEQSKLSWLSVDQSEVCDKLPHMRLQ